MRGVGGGFGGGVRGGSACAALPAPPSLEPTHARTPNPQPSTPLPAHALQPWTARGWTLLTLWMWG